MVCCDVHLLFRWKSPQVGLLMCAEHPDVLTPCDKAPAVFLETNSKPFPSMVRLPLLLGTGPPKAAFSQPHLCLGSGATRSYLLVMFPGTQLLYKFHNSFQHQQRLILSARSPGRCTLTHSPWQVCPLDSLSCYLRGRRAKPV